MDNIKLIQKSKNFVELHKDNESIGSAYLEDREGIVYNNLPDELKCKKLISIYAFHINSDLRRKGYGTLLMEEIINLCKEKRIKRIALGVEENNVGAIDLYEKAGFQLCKDGHLKYMYLNLKKWQPEKYILKHTCQPICQ